MYEKSGFFEVVFYDYEVVFCKLFEMFCDKEFIMIFLEDKNGEM